MQKAALTQTNIHWKNYGKKHSKSEHQKISWQNTRKSGEQENTGSRNPFHNTGFLALTHFDILLKMPYFVYIIECKNKSLYTGITTDLKRRFKEHKSGKGAHYTKCNPPKKIVYVEKYKNRSQASKREAEIKKWPRSKKINLINGSDQ